MTKEQAIKHKDVIKWWLNNTDKGVWRHNKLPDGKWFLDKIPEFKLEYKYVQNDKYAELRKAQADGKVIQSDMKPKSNHHWVDCPSEPSWELPVYMYRIKPDEPQFKIGDWVRVKNYNDIQQVVSITRNGVSLTNYSDDEYVFFNIDVELWQPQEDDVVVCWGTGSMRTLIKLDKDSLGDVLDEDVKAGRCIPYIGQKFEEMR